MKIWNRLNEPEYAFLKKHPNLGENIIMIALGGSHAYGTNTETSDVDIRGCALNTIEQLLGTMNNFEQIEDKATDTTIYSFNKLITLLAGCNPNTIEILGCKPEHYFYLHPVAEEMISNSKIFLSKRAAFTFGAYSESQLRCLENATNRFVGQSQQEQHILESINHARDTFPEKYFSHEEDNIRLYIDKAVQEGYDTEIFMDVNLKHYPLRDYKSMWSEMHNIVKDYSKIGRRNKHAIEHGKIGKHMMHLIRLYYMCFDILENEKIVTYREKEHDLLMDIRNGKFLDDNNQPIPEFFEMVNDLKKRLDYANENTSLPEKPDFTRINEFRMEVNERVVRGFI